MLAGCRCKNITEYYGSVLKPGGTELIIAMELMACSVADLVSRQKAHGDTGSSRHSEQLMGLTSQECSLGDDTPLSATQAELRSSGKQPISQGSPKHSPHSSTVVARTARVPCHPPCTLSLSAASPRAPGRGRHRAHPA